MDHTDAALVELCLAGRKDSYGELVERHKDRVFHLALRMTGDRDEATDLAQETFIRAYRKLGMYNSEYAFGSWLLSICANLGKNRLRSDARRRKAQEIHVELFPRTPEPPNPQRAALEAALPKIHENLRTPLVLKHVEGLSYEEIAQILKIGVSAAKMRVKRGRDELVRLLRSAVGEEKS
jgi:RNA polymerase sigma-70 factor (ECF subfamily)